MYVAWRDRNTAFESHEQRKAFARVRKAELQYSRKLRGVARQVGFIQRAFGSLLDGNALMELQQALEGYSRLLRPWAVKTAQSMLVDVSRRDRSAWLQLSKTFTRSLREEIDTAPTGEMLRQMMQENVALITSIPLDAAQEVQRVAIESVTATGARAKELSKRIQRLGHVSVGRANTIARTETARAASSLTAVRATNAGSVGYIWRTAGDSDVRKSHKEMEGKFVKWDEPPTLSDGTKTHAGGIYNCRCYPEVVLPEIAD